MADPEVEADVFAQAEALMRTVEDAERREVAAAMAPLVADEIGLDLEQASEEAMAFLESFPVPGRAAVNLAEEASRWLALRTATDERRAELRECLEGLAEAAAGDYPLTAQALRGLVAEPVPEDPREDPLWVAVVRAIVEDRLGELE